MATVLIARCPEHGLHGERTECFVCHGPVEQVAMMPADYFTRKELAWLEASVRSAAADSITDGATRGDALLDLAGKVRTLRGPT